MQSIKIFLTIAVCLLTWSALANPALPIAQSSSSLDAPPVDAVPAPEPLKREFIGYAWPFADRDLKTELAGGPIVLEEFTTQGCIFCPVADKFFNDLIANAPNVIALACHVTYLNVREGNISNKNCTDRQFEYSKTIVGGSVFTPQMIVNGRKQTFGFEYEKVFAALKESLKQPPAAITITKGEGTLYSFTLPAVKISGDEKAELQVIQVRKPLERSISDGPNQAMTMNYMRSVALITTVDVTGKAQTIEQDVVPEADVESIVVMVRVNGNILAVGEAKL